MATVSGILSSVWDILKSLVPAGVEPVLFFTTFLITTALVFAIMQVISFFSKKENRPVAFIVALVVGYFTASSAFVTIMVSKLFPNIGLAIMAIIGVMLVLVFLAPKSFEKGLGVSPIIGLGIFLVIIWLTWVFAAPALESAGVMDTIRSSTGFGITNEDVALVITVAIIIGGLYFLFKGPSEDTGEEGFLKKMFKIYR